MPSGFHFIRISNGAYLNLACVSATYPQADGEMLLEFIDERPNTRLGRTDAVHLERRLRSLTAIADDQVARDLAAIPRPIA